MSIQNGVNNIKKTIVYQNISLYEMTDMFCENMALKCMKYGFEKMLVGSSSLNSVYNVLDNEKVKVACSIAYPSGAYILESKCNEIECLDAMGYKVDELYIVPAFSRYLSGYKDEFKSELKILKNKANGRPVHIFVEAGIMENEQMEDVCSIAFNSGIESIVASTGFAKYFSIDPPAYEQIKKMIIASEKKIKVSFCGELTDIKEAEKLLDMGVSELLVTDPCTLLVNHDLEI